MYVLSCYFCSWILLSLPDNSASVMFPLGASVAVLLIMQRNDGRTLPTTIVSMLGSCPSA